MPNGGLHTALRFHKYIEIDTARHIEIGPHIFFIPPPALKVSRDSTQQSRPAAADAQTLPRLPHLVVGPASPQDLSRPLLALDAGSKQQHFVDFSNNGASCGHIGTSQEGGVMVRLFAFINTNVRASLAFHIHTLRGALGFSTS